MTFKKIFNQKLSYYWLSFIIPFAAILTYFVCHNFDFLTVDLGQQYIDFLAFFKQNILTNPGQLIFSFHNGLGESMLATDAYYLLSPLNLLLCFFPTNLIPFCTLIIISIKIGLAGLSAYYLWKHKYQIKENYILAASLGYSLSGYIVANYFNLMWLDTMILLPLLIQAIDQILLGQKDHLILITFLIWFTNFYTGYMALLFGFIYFLSQIALKTPNQNNAINLKHSFWSYLLKSILGSLSASFILLPVFFELIKNPALSTSSWSLSFQYNPAMIIDKLITGSYNYHEMQEGMPNVYTASLIYLTTFLYFISKKIPWKEKIINGIVLFFLVLSLSFTPFVLFWHLFKFPIWYPGRFTFVLIFFVCQLALSWLARKEQLDFKQKISIFSLTIFLSAFWFFTKNQVTFINSTNLTIGILLLFLALIFFYFIWEKFKYASVIFVGTILFEVVINLILSLNNLSFQKNQDFTNFQTNVLEVTNYLKSQDKGLYRTEKTFSRSDNDPFTANYNGISNFNSITDNAVTTLLGKLGYQYNSNSYGNIGGSIVTDSLLGIKYYLQPNFESNQMHVKNKMIFNNQIARNDLNYYFEKKKFTQLKLFENYSALPIIFTTGVTTSPKFDSNPMQNQINLLNSITPCPADLLTNVPLPKPTYKNAKLSHFSKFIIKTNKMAASVEFTINTQANKSYYLLIPSDLDEDDISLIINNIEYDLSTRDDQNRLINFNSSGTSTTIKFTLNHSNINLSDIKLYALNIAQFTSLMSKFKKDEPTFKQTSNFKIESNVFTTAKPKMLRTTIPYSHNWFIFDNGKLLSSSKFAHTFVQAYLEKGTHHVQLVYIPIAFLVGISISLIALVFIKIFYL